MSRVEYGRGIDAFQALTTALEGIRVTSHRSSTPPSGAGVLDNQDRASSGSYHCSPGEVAPNGSSASWIRRPFAN